MRNIRVGDSVRFTSTETSKNAGVVERMEYDRQYGDQYLVRVQDNEMGYEHFWIKNKHIRLF